MGTVLEFNAGSCKNIDQSRFEILTTLCYQDIIDRHLRIVFKPMEEINLIEICMINVIKDASWLQKGVRRPISLGLYTNLFDPAGNPTKYDSKELKNLNKKLKRIERFLIENVEIELSKVEEELKNQIKREFEHRNINERTLDLIKYQFLSSVFALGFMQIVLFFQLKSLARF
ncbi:hypothetical protein WICMUC_002999 [Wickerhamomyces mucosus]|uniref:GOLD domain-containing protein n=1 Tax=Wickerhamomyces mucosus TaxID=1378264 RepID=A0A9P8TDX4_9ASCO|nr:hypothetical protein WICMUC_002999 [Wickerhamomyces mucosus]